MKRFKAFKVFMPVFCAAVSAVLCLAVSPAHAGTAEDIVRFTNEERSEYGLTRLKIDNSLMKAAAERARECAVDYSHTRPDGSECFTILEEYRVSYSSMAENIYYDTSSYRSASRTVAGWMNSPGHRKNILTPEFTHIGVGVYTEDGKNYAVQLFIKK